MKINLRDGLKVQQRTVRGRYGHIKHHTGIGAHRNRKKYYRKIKHKGKL